MNPDRRQRVLASLFLYALIIFFLSDSVNKIVQVTAANNGIGDFENSFSLSAYVRFIFEFLVFILFFVFSNSKKTLILLSIVFLFLIYLIGNLIFASNIPYQYDFTGNFKIFNKYIFFFIIYYSFEDIYLQTEKFKLIEKGYVSILLLNSICIILGAIFQIKYFKSYHSVDYRFGYNGLIPLVNESTLFYLIGISYLYFKRYILNEKEGVFWVIVIAAMLIGAKGVYLFIILIFIYHFIKIFNMKSRIIALGIIITVVFVITYNLIDYILSAMDFFIWQYEINGLYSMLLSSRDILFSERLSLVFPHWNYFNYIFGGQDQVKTIFELDFVDLFFFFGLLGSAIYLIIYFQIVRKVREGKRFVTYFFVIFLAGAFFTGHYFASALNSLYLAFLFIYIKSLPIQFSNRLDE